MELDQVMDQIGTDSPADAGESCVGAWD